MLLALIFPMLNVLGLMLNLVLTFSHVFVCVCECVFSIAIFIMDIRNVQPNSGQKLQICVFGIDNLPNKRRLKMPNSTASVDRSLYSGQSFFSNVDWSPICDSIFDSIDTAYKCSTVQNHWKNSRTPIHHRWKNNGLHSYSMGPIQFWI